MHAYACSYIYGGKLNLHYEGPLHCKHVFVRSLVMKLLLLFEYFVTKINQITVDISEIE